MILPEKVWGPYTHSDGRQIVIKKYKHGTRITQQYGRYLMELKLGRNLLSSECVDHINNNPSDNRIENLQILTLSENKKKEMPIEWLEVECPQCSKIFNIRMSIYKEHQIKRNQEGPFCNIVCRGLAHRGFKR